MESQGLSSAAGLMIQCTGIVLVLILSFFMTRSIRRTSLDYWTIAWLCLALSLGALLASFYASSEARFLQPLYFLGEYAFAYMFLAGCRNRSSGYRLSRRDWRYLVLGVAVALVLGNISADFNRIFIPHAAIVSFLLGCSLYVSRQGAKIGKANPGIKVMSIALLLLTVDFFHYVPVFLYATLTNPGQPLPYLRYTSIYDLILEILLGFGTMMVVMDDVRQEVVSANEELTRTRDRLERLARMDPLTEALNRHAFYSLMRPNAADDVAGPVGGCVIITDIDNLKPVNDTIGHTAGDGVIRAVANVIRSSIRANDLLFRWGGDEFMVLLFGVAEHDARRRIGGLNRSLSDLQIPGVSTPVTVSVSFGVAAFRDISEIEQAIEKADSDMYASKQSRRPMEKTHFG